MVLQPTLPLISKTGRAFKETIEEICTIVKGPVSAEVVSVDAEGYN